MPVRVYVELPNSLDVTQWRRKHYAGLAPDAAPYGLHHLAGRGDDVRFRDPLGATPWAPIAEVTRARTWGWEFARELAGLNDPLRRSADVIVCMDERTGGPAALLSGRTPVVTGIGWLETRADLGRVASATAHLALTRAQAVFTQCAALVPTLIEEFGLERRRVHAIRLGIDTDHFAAHPTAEDPYAVFSVGDDRMRDHATLIEAIAQVNRAGVPARLALATTLPVGLPADLGVVHARRMDHEVRAYYARSRVVAVALRPTRQGSGLTVALEAMASARPLVITGNPGLEQYVEHGVTGLLVPPGDASAMAQAVRSLLLDPEAAAEMGRQARRRVMQLFTSRDMAEDLLDILHGLA